MTFLSPPPAVLSFIIEGEPVPAQMGAVLPNGRVARKGMARVRAYKDKARLLTMLAVNRARWESRREDSFGVTFRIFVGNARTIDVDNCCKALLDSLKGPAFPDDRQVIDLHAHKRIDRERPRVEVTIERIQDQ